MYVARRLVRFASEDVGLADPQALPLAVAAAQATHQTGMPEASTALAEAVLYLATAPKSNAVYRAYGEAASQATRDATEPVPHHLRNAPTSLMKNLGYGAGYRYAHDEPDAIAAMDCLPPRLQGMEFYRPTPRGYEKTVRDRLERWKALKRSRAACRPHHGRRFLGPLPHSPSQNCIVSDCGTVPLWKTPVEKCGTMRAGVRDVRRTTTIVIEPTPAVTVNSYDFEAKADFWHGRQFAVIRRQG